MFNNIQYPPRQVDFDKIFRIDICFLGDFWWSKQDQYDTAAYVFTFVWIPSGTTFRSA